MQVTRVATGAVDTEADALVVGVYADGSLGGPAAEVDKALKGIVSDLIERKEFAGKPNETLQVWSNGHLDAQQVVLVGLGERRKLDRHAAFAAAGAAANKLAVKQRARIA